jgi:hypothetical protein
MARRASCAVFAAVTMLSLAGGTRAGEKAPAPRVALDPGDYELVLDQDSRATVERRSKGSLVLRETQRRSRSPQQRVQVVRMDRCRLEETARAVGRLLYPR